MTMTTTTVMKRNAAAHGQGSDWRLPMSGPSLFCAKQGRHPSPQGKDLEDDETFDISCSECEKKTLSCYRSEKGTACRHCRVNKRRCDHTAQM